jgi:hypothetical protein
VLKGECIEIFVIASAAKQPRKPPLAFPVNAESASWVAASLRASQ